jgi:hypothetical protein
VTVLALERREMNAGIHHQHYRVVPAGFARGFWIGICKVCPNPNGPDRYSTAKNGNSHGCETALIAHLKDKHGIDANALK